jgi:uncharacterized protein YdhG (YjbR/CyaY superfamily)
VSKYPEYLSVNNYISYQPAEHQANLELIRHTILSAVPEALETISYNMPAFKYHGMLCFYAVFKDHYSLFVSPQVRKAFDTELKSFKTTKSTIHFLFDQPLPVKLITEIIRFAAITNLEKAQSRMSKKKQ